MLTLLLLLYLYRVVYIPQTDSTGLYSKRILIMTPTLDPPLIAKGTTVEQFYTVNNTEPGDFIIVLKPTSSPHCMSSNEYVSAPNTLSITWAADSKGDCNPPSENYTIMIFRD